MPHEAGHPWSKEWEESQYTSTNNEDMSDMSPEDWGAVAGGLGTFAGGLGDIIGAGKRIGTQEGYRDTAQEDIDKFWEQYKSGKFDMTMDPKMLQYFSMGRRDTDTTPALSAMATGLEAASTDPRMMASMIPGMTGQYSNVMQDQARKDFEQQLAMRGAEGQAYQGVNQANMDFMRQIYGDKLTQDQTAYAQALGNIEEIKANRAKGIGNVIGGAVQTVGGLYSGGVFGEDGMKIPKYDMGGDIMAQIMAAQGGAEGDVPARQELPGPESHEENPIDMVAPNGEKVGEATGGEIILNSEQTEMIEGAVAAVDEAIKSGEQPSMEQLMDVYKAVSETLSQPQFQDGPGEGSEEDMMRARMEMMLGEQQVA